MELPPSTIVRYLMQEDAAFDKFFYTLPSDFFENPVYSMMRSAFEFGIEFHRKIQWRRCDGDDLPPYDMAVIVRMADAKTGEFFTEAFCHRSNDPEVAKDENGWVIRCPNFKCTEWCYVPEFDSGNIE